MPPDDSRTIPIDLEGLEPGRTIPGLERAGQPPDDSRTIPIDLEGLESGRTIPGLERAGGPIAAPSPATSSGAFCARSLEMDPAKGGPRCTRRLHPHKDGRCTLAACPDPRAAASGPYKGGWLCAGCDATLRRAMLPRVAAIRQLANRDVRKAVVAGESMQGEIGPAIASGGFGAVHVFGDESRKLIIKKPIKPNLLDELEEIKKAARVKGHPNIGESHAKVAEGVIQGRYGEQLSKVLNDLRSEKASLGEGPYYDTLTALAKQALSGIAWIHFKQYVHGDIKGGNILVDAGRHVRIIDFGTLAVPGARLAACTPRYVPKECVGTRKVLKRMDLFALGQTLHEGHEGGPFDPARAPPVIRFKDGPPGGSRAELLLKFIVALTSADATATEMLKHPFLAKADEVLARMGLLTPPEPAAREGEGPAFLPPSYLTVATLMPTLAEWKANSSMGRTHVRSHSAVRFVDQALEEFWTAFAAVREGAGGTTGEQVTRLKAALKGVERQIDGYLAALTGLDLGIVQAAFHEKGEGARSPADAHIEVYGAKARADLRAGLEEAHRRRKGRVPATLALRRIVVREGVRWRGWVAGPLPLADQLVECARLSLLPSVEVWKLESAGGALKRRKGGAAVTKVDEALEKACGAFRWADKAATLELLKSLELEAGAYLKHRSRDPTRVNAVERLMHRAHDERQRLEERWGSFLLPPLVVRPEPATTDVDPISNDLAFMELRTSLPTTDVWKARTSVRGVPRWGDLRVLDRELARFWTSFRAKDRGNSIGAARAVAIDAAILSNFSDEPEEATGTRVEAARWLYRLANDEWRRLESEWKSGELPPPVCDNDSFEEPATREELAADLRKIEEEVAAGALAPVTGDDIKSFIGKAVSSDFDATDRGSVVGRSELALTDWKDPWFGRSRCFAQVIHEPRAASAKILEEYRKSRKWVRRQLVAIQATSIVKYLAGVREALEKKGSIDGDAYVRHKELFERVISVADHAAREAYRARTEMYATLAKLGWDKHKDLLLPMLSVCQILLACKWKSSATGTVLSAVHGYGEVRAVSTAAGLALSISAEIENVVKLGGGTVTKAAFAGVSHVSGAGLTILGTVAQGVNLPKNFYDLYKSCQEGYRLQKVFARYALLGKLHPEVVRIIDSSPLFHQLRVALAGKLGRREARAGITGSAAAAGIASGGIAIYASVAGLALTNAWNPVGWALGGAAAATGIVMLIYKIRRKSVQQAALADLARKHQIPAFVSTAGEWDRYRIADVVFRAALNDGSMGPELLAIGYALLFILFGGDMPGARDTALKMGYPGIMAFIKG